jgi:hypothetical protein
MFLIYNFPFFSNIFIIIILLLIFIDNALFGISQILSDRDRKVKLLLLQTTLILIILINRIAIRVECVLHFTAT